MLLAEIDFGLETLIGGGVTGMMGLIMIAFLKRTRETDERHDALTKIVLDVAAERESRAAAERDKALAERDAMRAKLDEVRAEHDPNKEAE